MMTPFECASTLAVALDSKKGQALKLLDTGSQTTLADYFIICTATSPAQVRALSDACEEAIEKKGERVHHIEGKRDGAWMLLDFSSVVVHIFTEEGRKFYDLERLWADAQEVSLDEILQQA